MVLRSRPVSVSCSFCNKLSRAEQLRTAEVSPLMVVEARSPKPSVGRMTLPPKAAEKSPFFASPSFQRLSLLLAVATSLQSLPLVTALSVLRKDAGH